MQGLSRSIGLQATPVSGYLFLLLICVCNIYIYMYVYMCIYIYVYICIHKCICIGRKHKHMCVYIYICMYVAREMEEERQGTPRGTRASNVSIRTSSCLKLGPPNEGEGSNQLVLSGGDSAIFDV